MTKSIEKLKPLINFIEDHIGTTFNGYSINANDLSNIPIHSDNSVDRFYTEFKPICLVVKTNTGFTYTYSSAQPDEDIKMALEYLKSLTVTKIVIGEDFNFDNIEIGDELILNGQIMAVTKVVCNGTVLEDDGIELGDDYSFFCCMKGNMDDLEYARLADEGMYDIILKDKLLIGSIHIKHWGK